MSCVRGARAVSSMGAGMWPTVRKQSSSPTGWLTSSNGFMVLNTLSILKLLLCLKITDIFETSGFSLPLNTSSSGQIHLWLMTFNPNSPAMDFRFEL